MVAFSLGSAASFVIWAKHTQVQIFPVIPVLLRLPSRLLQAQKDSYASWRECYTEMKLSEGRSYLIQKVFVWPFNVCRHIILCFRILLFPKDPFFPRTTGRLADPTDEIFWNVPDAIVLLCVTSPTRNRTCIIVAVVSKQFPVFSH